MKVSKWVMCMRQLPMNQTPRFYLSKLIPSQNIKKMSSVTHLKQLIVASNAANQYRVICILLPCLLYSLCMLPKCLDMKFKQHKCLDKAKFKQELWESLLFFHNFILGSCCFFLFSYLLIKLVFKDNLLKVTLVKL